MGPTVCELEGPIPILKISKTESVMANPALPAALMMYPESDGATQTFYDEFRQMGSKPLLRIPLHRTLQCGDGLKRGAFAEVAGRHAHMFTKSVGKIRAVGKTQLLRNQADLERGLNQQPLRPAHPLFTQKLGDGHT